MRFSIRQMLYGMVVAALIAAVIGAGANGSPLAFGLGISICLLVIYFLVFALLYWSVLFVFGGKLKMPTEVQESEQNGATS